MVNGKWKVVNAKFFLLLTTFYLPFTTIFRGRLMAGRRILAPEIKVQILSPKPNVFISGRSADDYTDLPWEQVFAGLNPAAQTKFFNEPDRRQV